LNNFPGFNFERAAEKEDLIGFLDINAGVLFPEKIIQTHVNEGLKNPKCRIFYETKAVDI